MEFEKIYTAYFRDVSFIDGRTLTPEAGNSEYMVSGEGEPLSPATQKESDE